MKNQLLALTLAAATLPVSAGPMVRWIQPAGALSQECVPRRRRAILKLNCRASRRTN